MGQSGSVGSHTVNVCRREASAMVRPLDASGAAPAPTPAPADMAADEIKRD